MIECPECGQSFDAPNRAGLVPLHWPGGARCDGSLKEPVEVVADPDEPTRRVTVAFTEAEWAAVDEFAGEEGTTAPAAIRYLVLTALSLDGPEEPPLSAAERPAAPSEGETTGEAVSEAQAAPEGSADVPDEFACPTEAERDPKDG
jgi:hypothetical protein